MVVLKKYKILILAIILVFINIPITLAKPKIKIITSKQNIQLEEELQLNINISDVDIASFTLEIYFNEEKLEYITGPNNSNFSNSRILYTWVSENGQNKQNLDVGTFIFKSKEKGIANIVVTGNFFNSDGEKVELDRGIAEIKIDDIQDNQNQLNQENENNSSLSILRLNQEGISPVFSPDIKEYYIVVNQQIQELQVTAISQSKNALVTIKGNNNLKIGENIIEIKVQSKDGSNTSLYKIYVTRTENKEKANANLETLAIRQATLIPEFDSNTTQYKIELASDITKLDILAIPQKENASVKIFGNDEMKIGSNNIEVTVTAEDGETNKKYVIYAYRRNEKEDLKYYEEQQIEAEKLAIIFKEKKSKNNQIDNINENFNQNEVNIKESDDNNKGKFIWIIIALIMGFALYIIVKKYYNLCKKN